LVGGKKGVAANDFAAASLAEGLKSRFHLPGGRLVQKLDNAGRLPAR
jgi:hypothetical protein